MNTPRSGETVNEYERVKHPLNDCLAHLQVNEDDLIPLSEQAIKDLGVWRNFLCDSEKWHPIPPRPCNQPLAIKLFVSDAAGSDDGAAYMLDKGVGCIGLDE